MSNSLIPYSFVPGTKAKAQEVNANFLAVAEKIQEVQTNAAEQISELTEDVEEGMQDLYDDCVKNVIADSNTVSYTIINAPNGVASYTDGYLTICSGMKILAPDGKNSDGTLKSEKYTLASDITITLNTYQSAVKNVWLCSDGSYFMADENYYFISDTEPTNTSNLAFVWYNPKTNVLKQYSAELLAWVEKKAVLIVRATIENYVITGLKPQPVLSLLKQDDFMKLSGIGMPSSRYIDLTIGVNSAEYTMPANGWLVAQEVTTGTATAHCILMSNITSNYNNTQIGWLAGGGFTVMSPVRHGDVIKYTWLNVDTSNQDRYLRFIYAEGEK